MSERRRKPAKQSTYVRHAVRLARATPGGVISAGQVAWHAHRKPAGNWNNALLDVEADTALHVSGLFERASFLNCGRFSDITLWRLR